MLVVEYGRALAGRAIDRGDLFEKLVARVEVLALFIVAVAAVLADEQDAVDGEGRAALRQGVGDGGIDGQFREALFRDRGSGPGGRPPGLDRLDRRRARRGPSPAGGGGRSSRSLLRSDRRCAGCGSTCGR